IAQQLINRGFRVRGTVRSAEKGEYLTNLVKSDKWSYVIVEDVEQEGAFDEAVKGVDAVLHTASPFHFRVTDPYTDLIHPAVRGTEGLLSSALKERKIQRVVVTSSFAAIVNPHDPVYTFTEKDWNETSPKMVEEKGKDVDPLIFGPIIHQCPSADKLNTSVNNFYQYLIGKKDAESAQTGFGSLVDVRDVARLHIDSLVTAEAGGQRFLVSNTDGSYQPLLDVFFAHASDSLKASFPNAERGKPGTPKPKQNVIDAGKAKKVFGIDMAKSLAEYQTTW
ncbi:SPOSA6832_04619, partial [Sporobolomyces salmonicolor]